MHSEEMLRIIRACGVVEAGISVDDSVLDTGFGDLGFDSVALLEITGQIEREFDVELAEDAVVPMITPRELLALVNDG